jgi:hypothetical protein
MSWASFWQLIICVLLGGWLRTGRGIIPGQPAVEKLAEAIGRRIRGTNGEKDLPQLPRTGV